MRAAMVLIPVVWLNTTDQPLLGSLRGGNKKGIEGCQRGERQYFSIERSLPLKVRQRGGRERE